MDIDEYKSALVTGEGLLREKSRLLASVSRELRTPRTATLGLVEVYSQNDLNPAERVRYNEIAQNNGLHLARIIDDLLCHSKIEAGLFHYEARAISLSSLLIELIAFNGIVASNKGIVFTLNCDVTAPDVVLCDDNRLRQILNNIIGNVIKFTCAAGIESFMFATPVPAFPMKKRRRVNSDSNLSTFI